MVDLSSSLRDTLWLLGIAISLLCLIVQGACYVVVRSCRKYDEIVLTQMSCARLLFTVSEFVITVLMPSGDVIKNVLFVAYMSTDFMMICWMFVFSKNLYQKTVVVFNYKRCCLRTLSWIIYSVSLLIGLVCPFLLKHDNGLYFKIYYKSYGIVKFGILLVNVIFFMKIFSVAFEKGCSIKRGVREYFKTIVIGFILILISSLHVFINDLLTFWYEDYLANIVCSIMNSYQIVFMTVIFFLITTNKLKDYAASGVLNRRVGFSISRGVTISESEDRRKDDMALESDVKQSNIASKDSTTISQSDC